MAGGTLIGETLGHYRILEKIGGGGMGEVYLAEDLTLERRIALKVLPASMASDPASLARFEREAKTIAPLNDPHIVTIHSVEHAGAVHFLTMELIDGASLDRSISPGGMPLPELIRTATAIARTLAARRAPSSQGDHGRWAVSSSAPRTARADGHLAPHTWQGSRRPPQDRRSA